MTVIAQSISWFQAFILGIIQGLAEFLPISSSGHLQVVETAMGIEALPRLFDVMLHIGTLTAVFIVFWHDLVRIIKKPLSKLPIMIVIATVPTVVIALIFEKLLPALSSGEYLGYGFMLTGILLYSMEMIPMREEKKKKLSTMTWKDAVFIGCAQGIGTLPGVSRSGSTIAGGVFCGMKREFLAKFSFLMSIPAILGAFCLDVYKMIKTADVSETVQIGAFPMIIGVITAGVVGYFAIRYMLKIIATKSFKPFAIYTLILGFAVCMDKFVFHLIF